MVKDFPGPSLAVQSGGGELQTPALRLIELLLVVYIYNDLQDTFKHLPGMPAHIHVQIHNARKALQLVDTGTVAFTGWHLPATTVSSSLSTPQPCKAQAGTDVKEYINSIAWHSVRDRAAWHSIRQ